MLGQLGVAAAAVFVLAVTLSGCQSDHGGDTPGPPTQAPTEAPTEGQCQSDGQPCTTDTSTGARQGNCCHELECIYNKETESSFCYDLTRCVGAGSICDYYKCCAGLSCESIGPVLMCKEKVASVEVDDVYA
eukprot:TRINITY_DN35153_c0_g1_i1.p1 TRINITY_DN35153_c0_g1~~TRINITY_DN35153_c0_g1_i1.p1  ORF type:complete len:132 (+),score=5.71 TRINITY_DN35153_c0_g1_i1:66-461(+)